jgi:opacity protein-like surface antigen
MKKLALAACAALSLTLSPVRAADMSPPPPILQAPPMPFVELGSNWYLRGDFAHRMYDTIAGIDPDDTAVLGLGVGYRFNNWFRADATVDYAFRSDLGAARLWTSSALVNGYIDLGTWWGVTPYIGAGIGASYNYLDLGGDSGRWNFAWAGMAGAAYHLSQNLSVDFGYRYADLGRVNAFGGDVTAHELRVGFRYLID